MNPSIEKIIFENENLIKIKNEDLKLVFILGSPRTGSTLLYQILSYNTSSNYFSNLMNVACPQFPIIGFLIQKEIPNCKISYESDYGKTKDILAPSEGSLIFRNWFGGEHPSQSKSNIVLINKYEHMINTFKAFQYFSKSDNHYVVTKNAWNCFRIRNLKKVFPNITFVWIRRDIVGASLSDLYARYRNGNPQVTWNSATLSNYKEIQKLHYCEQVVEQQYQYNETIYKDLEENNCKYFEVWYEDICESNDKFLELIKFLHENVDKNITYDLPPKFTKPRNNFKVSYEDYSNVLNYAYHEKFKNYIKRDETS
jgi:hypothetical protein